MKHLEPLAYSVFALYSAILAASVCGAKLPAPNFIYRLADVMAAILFVMALHKASNSRGADSMRTSLYFGSALAMLVLLYAFNVKTGSSKWRIYDGLGVGGMLASLAGNPLAAYIK